jgi:hypothetical protein
MDALWFMIMKMHMAFDNFISIYFRIEARKAIKDEEKRCMNFNKIIKKFFVKPSSFFDQTKIDSLIK